MNYFIHEMQRPDPHAKRLSQIVQEDEFLMGLHSKAAEGCVALKHGQNIDIIIIGSSHAYAAIDLYALKSTLGNKHVAMCTLPTWNTDFLHPFMTFLATENLSPKRLIWVADAGTPLKLGQHDKRLDYARAILSESETQKKISNAWIENIEAGLPPLKLSKELYQKQRRLHHDKITSLSLAQVKQRLEAFPKVSEGNLAAVLNTAKINPQNKNNLRRFCTDLKLRGMELDIIVAPVPDITSKLIARYSSDTDYADLSEFLAANVACAQSVVSPALNDWGLDERYFINRFLKEDYAYDIWGKPEDFSLFYENLPRRSQINFYNPDHMNPVGAVIFSQKIGELFQD
jgi:hypothetical protein